MSDDMALPPQSVKEEAFLQRAHAALTRMAINNHHMAMNDIPLSALAKKVIDLLEWEFRHASADKAVALVQSVIAQGIPDDPFTLDDRIVKAATDHLRRDAFAAEISQMRACVAIYTRRFSFSERQQEEAAREICEDGWYNAIYNALEPELVKRFPADALQRQLPEMFPASKAEHILNQTRNAKPKTLEEIHAQLSNVNRLLHGIRDPKWVKRVVASNPSNDNFEGLTAHTP